MLLVAQRPAVGQTVLFVDASRITGANDGSSWQNAYQGSLGLQAALLSAHDAAQIWVARGRYLPAPPGGSRTESFMLKSGVALYGGFAGAESFLAQRDPTANPTLLSGDLNNNDTPNFGNTIDNSRHVVRAIGVDATSVLDGFVIRDGYANGDPVPRNNWGANLFLEGGAPVIRDCVITKGYSSNAGGGAALDACSATFDRCLFSANQCQSFGGGLVDFNAGSPLITNCRFEANVGGSGTGVYVGPYFVNGQIGGNASVRDCVFINNEGRIGAASGIGMFIDRCPVQVVRCQFIQNTTDAGGGGLFLSGTASQIVSCDFVRNEAPGDGGGAVFVSGASATASFANCRFIGNNGAFNVNGGSAVAVNCTIANNSFNTPPFQGWPAVNCGGQIVLRNCVVWGNANINHAGLAGVLSGFGITADYCCIQSWDGSRPGVGSFAADPFFVAPLGPDGQLGTLDDDVRLQVGSPCAEAGIDLLLPPDSADLDDDGNTAEPLPSDLDSRPRIMKCHVDLGAFEIAAGEPGSGDMTGDGVVALSDVEPFVAALLTAAPDCIPDVNADGHVDGLDIAVFVGRLLAL